MVAGGPPQAKSATAVGSDTLHQGNTHRAYSSGSGEFVRDTAQSDTRGPFAPSPQRSLTVLDPPGGARVLTGTAARLGPLLRDPGLVHDPHATGVAQVFGHVREPVVADGVGVPIGAGEQVLHPVRGDLAQALGQWPAVLPVGVAEQRAHVSDGPPPRLGPGEVAADPLAHRVHPLTSSAVGCRAASPLRNSLGGLAYQVRL